MDRRIAHHFGDCRAAPAPPTEAQLRAALDWAQRHDADTWQMMQDAPALQYQYGLLTGSTTRTHWSVAIAHLSPHPMLTITSRSTGAGQDVAARTLRLPADLARAAA